MATAGEVGRSQEWENKYKGHIFRYSETKNIGQGTYKTVSSN